MWRMSKTFLHQAPWVSGDLSLEASTSVHVYLRILLISLALPLSVRFTILRLKVLRSNFLCNISFLILSLMINFPRLILFSFFQYVVQLNLEDDCSQELHEVSFGSSFLKLLLSL